MNNTLLSLLASDLEANGCAIRFRNARTLEVYGVNLSEHYVLTLTKPLEAAYDLLFVPQRYSDTVTGEASVFGR